MADGWPTQQKVEYVTTWGGVNTVIMVKAEAIYGVFKKRLGD